MDAKTGGIGEEGEVEATLPRCQGGGSHVGALGARGVSGGVARHCLPADVPRGLREQSDAGKDTLRGEAVTARTGIGEEERRATTETREEAKTREWNEGAPFYKRGEGAGHGRGMERRRKWQP